MNDPDTVRGADSDDPILVSQIDRDDFGDPWAAWDDIGGQG
jgi:hypothetical protein